MQRSRRRAPTSFCRKTMSTVLAAATVPKQGAASPAAATATRPNKFTKSIAERCRVRTRSSMPSSSRDDSADLTAQMFEGSILQDVRKGQSGFATKMSVLATDNGKGERKPVLGDIVTISFTCRTEEGEQLHGGGGGGGEEARDGGVEEEPITFEVGAADVIGNPLFRAFDKAVQNLSVGESAVVAASGGAYDPNLLFAVPADHDEITRLQTEWVDKGGLVEGTTVTLSNGNPAVVRAMDAKRVMLDANHPFAGSDIQFTVVLRAIEESNGLV